MSIIRQVLDPEPNTPIYNEAKKQLLDKWKDESADVSSQPVIKMCVTESGPYAGVDIFVVWDEFHQIPYPDRDRLIRECYREVKNPRDVEDKTVLGITSDQARRMNMCLEVD